MPFTILRWPAVTTGRSVLGTSGVARGHWHIVAWRSTGRDGFALLELLVVLGVLLILAALLLPMLSRTREQGRRAICASNQRQVVTSCTSYGNDYDGRLPATFCTSSAKAYWPRAWPVIWWEALSDQYGLDEWAGTCPSWPMWFLAEFSLLGGNEQWSPGGKGVYYSTLIYVGNPEAPPAQSTSWWRDFSGVPQTIHDDGGTVMTADLLQTPHNDWALPVGSYRTPHASVIGDWTTDRSDLAGINVGYLDAHVAWKSEADFPQQLINQKNQPNSPNLIHMDNNVFNTSVYW